MSKDLLLDYWTNRQTHWQTYWKTQTDKQIDKQTDILLLYYKDYLCPKIWYNIYEYILLEDVMYSIDGILITGSFILTSGHAPRDFYGHLRRSWDDF